MALLMLVAAPALIAINADLFTFLASFVAICVALVLDGGEEASSAQGPNAGGVKRCQASPDQRY